MLVVLMLSVAMTSQIANAITTDACPSSLPKDKYLQVFEDKCYYLYVNTNKHYNDARDVCHDQGGTLAVVTSKQINEFLREKLSGVYKGNKKVWIGLNDLGEEGTFRWVDGSKFVYNNFATFQGTKSWGLQLFSSIAEDCVAMDAKTGYWHDYACQTILFWIDESRPFVCGFPAKTEHTNAPTSETDVATTTAITPTMHPSIADVTGTRTLCQPIRCEKDCGLEGYRTDSNSCVTCECNE